MNPTRRIRRLTNRRFGRLGLCPAGVCRDCTRRARHRTPASGRTKGLYHSVRYATGLE